MNSRRIEVAGYSGRKLFTTRLGTVAIAAIGAAIFGLLYSNSLEESLEDIFLVVALFAPFGLVIGIMLVTLGELASAFTCSVIIVGGILASVAEKDIEAFFFGMAMFAPLGLLIGIIIGVTNWRANKIFAFVFSIMLLAIVALFVTLFSTSTSSTMVVFSPGIQDLMGISVMLAPCAGLFGLTAIAVSWTVGVRKNLVLITGTGALVGVMIGILFGILAFAILNNIVFAIATIG